MRSGLIAVCVSSLAVAAVFYTPDAAACGGCFHPPAEQNSIITDHRMILSVSKTQSTLYDQINYQGNPSEFAWVLPISGTVDVGLSADSLFSAMDASTSVSVIEPPRNCPPAPDCGARGGSSSGTSGSFSDSASAPNASDGGVAVLKQEVVGPYETVQLKSDSAESLEVWLTEHNFSVPADVKPIIAQYTSEHFNFLALRLRPGEGVRSMRPVRVTTQGANVALPLRMVAAGTGATVGITLWVVSEGRYEPKNFPSFVIKNEDLVWDWNTSSSNYKALRAQRSAAEGGKTWEVESSTPSLRSRIESSVKNGFFGGIGNGAGPAAGGDYLPIEDDQGGVTKTADKVRDEDLATVFAGISGDRITRMRADLSRAALATDLLVTASADQAALSTTRNPQGELGQPQCPVFDPSTCAQTGTLPRDQAVAAAKNTAGTSSSDGTFTCRSTGGLPANGEAGLGALGAFLTLALVRAARERKRAR